MWYYNVFLVLISLVLFLILLQQSDSGANNLHVFDGTTTAEIIGSDIFFEITEPEELRYTYRARPAKDFGMPFNETFYQREAFLVPVQPSHGCGMPTNSDHLEGNIALIERGDCSFLSKTVRAQEAGAVAVLIADNRPINDNFYVEMIDDNTDRTPHIPAAFLLGINGHVIRRTLKELEMNWAVVNIPLNMTYVPFHKMNQPPWLEW